MAIFQQPTAFPEVWGGVECTINRVGDRFFRQLDRSGHLDRPEDLEMFAALGLRALRFPILWEQVAPRRLDDADWSWSDDRLARLQELGILPIAGLLHHGSGPAYTSLIDPDFPEKLACYARMVAERYPWIQYYTPVNEPLTTARFSGIYGIWYPHAADERSFVRCLLQQCRGIVAAMEAIRTVNPQARLVMTEDMGRTFATPLLHYQAEFENHRRWLSLDLLFGRIDRSDPLQQWLLKHGASEEELDRFAETTVRPAIIGLNYYITSDRVLDDRLHLYPQERHGGNGRHRYADVEAVRAWPEGILGHEELLREAWARYGTTLAMTEVHLGCTREEQLRWFQEAWQAAVKLRGEGIDIRAVTAWSLLGAFDWNSLLSADTGCYEPGVYDVRATPPRKTALALMLRSLAQTGKFDHPVLAMPGWWRRPVRFLPGLPMAQSGSSDRQDVSPSCRPLLISGKTGTLGQAFARVCELRGIQYRLLPRQELDIASPVSVAETIERYQPWAIINTAGFVRVDEAETEAAACYRENTTGPVTLAAACRAAGIRLVTFSSDLVFDGAKGAPYVEVDQVAPLNIYGRSKAEAERKVLECLSDALVVRTSAFFGPWDRYNFVTQSLERMSMGLPVQAARDLIVSPTYVPDLVDATLDLLLDGETGIWHINNTGAITWAELAMEAARMARLDHSLVESCTTDEFGYAARRPPHSVLSSERGTLLPSISDALERFFADSGRGTV